MAMRLPASQLKSDDLPTLGRPTMATCGTGTIFSLTKNGPLIVYQPRTARASEPGRRDLGVAWSNK